MLLITPPVRLTWSEGRVWGTRALPETGTKAVCRTRTCALREDVMVEGGRRLGDAMSWSRHQPRPLILIKRRNHLAKTADASVNLLMREARGLADSIGKAWSAA